MKIFCCSKKEKKKENVTHDGVKEKPSYIIWRESMGLKLMNSYVRHGMNFGIITYWHQFKLWNSFEILFVDQWILKDNFEFI